MQLQTHPRTVRDPRVDVLRGAALLMIFVDHLPGNPLAYLTLHNFGFCDAAELFVLLAGVSSMMAYGKLFARDGVVSALRRIGARILRMYLWQAGLLITTLIVVRLWTQHFHLKPILLAGMLDAGLGGLARGLLLQALPGYLEILPLYIVLLAVFPLIFFAARRSVWLAIGGSALVWLAANLDHRLNLPNWLDAKGWYFNPFTWQFLFTLGVASAVALQRYGGSLPRQRWLTAGCVAYLAFALMQTLPWLDVGLPDLRPLDMDPPDKSLLSPLRLADIMALFYLVFSADRLKQVARARAARALEACGKHSLEIFGLGCMLALFGRLTLRTWGRELPLVLAVNLAGLVVMCVVGLWLDRPRVVRAVDRPATAAAE